MSNEMTYPQVGDENAGAVIKAVVHDQKYLHLCYVVARKKNVAPGEDPYVTWMHNNQTGGYAHGHYGMIRKEAYQDMMERAGWDTDNE